MWSEKASGAQPSLVKQLDAINEKKRKIAAKQQFEKIQKLTKNQSELQDLKRRVLESRQNFLEFAVKNF